MYTRTCVHSHASIYLTETTSQPTPVVASLVHGRVFIFARILYRGRGFPSRRQSLNRSREAEFYGLRYVLAAVSASSSWNARDFFFEHRYFFFVSELFEYRSFVCKLIYFWNRYFKLALEKRCTPALCSFIVVFLFENTANLHGISHPQNLVYTCEREAFHCHFFAGSIHAYRASLPSPLYLHTMHTSVRLSCRYYYSAPYSDLTP